MRNVDDVTTVDNTNRLRESFNKLLNSGFESEQVQIQAKPAYSISNFKNLIKNRENNSLFLMDLDGTKDKREQRLKDNQLTDIQAFVFFMVQRMEAWILSQPEIIEEVFAYYKSKLGLENDTSIFNKHPEEILYPDDVLGIIFQRYFSITKNGKTKKLKYGKLRHSPDLIEKLDLQKLRKTFEDVERMILKINQISSKT